MTTALRAGLLDGRAVALGGSSRPDIADALRALGARVEVMPSLDGGEEERVGEWARAHLPLRALVACAGPGEVEDVLADVWVAVREVASGALIPAGAGGKIVLVGPVVARGGSSATGSPGTGSPAAVQAGLENLARTLSVEWARHRVTTVAVAPGPRAAEAKVADVVAYLVSPAGDYFSGARLDLGGDLR